MGLEERSGLGRKSPHGLYGELQVLANNNGADSTHSQGREAAWESHQGSDGVLIDPNGSGTTQEA